MGRRLAAIGLVALTTASFSTAEALKPNQYEPVPQQDFKNVTVGARFDSPDVESNNQSSIADFKVSTDHTKPDKFVLQTKPSSAPKLPKTIPTIWKVGSIYKGTASWYCLPGVSRCTTGYSTGFYAAIRKDLLSRLRGKTIQVCFGTRCHAVTVIDCNCGLHANLIDLYSTAFRYFAPLSTGRIPVTLKY